MRKQIVVVLGLVALLCLSAAPVWAGAVINKSNLSADYFRSLTRHASTDAIDIIAYNPAGVMKMANGFYTKMDVMYIAKDYSNTVPSTFPIPSARGEFESDVPSLVPGLFTLYKKDKWAGFFAVTVPGGGGEVDFERGNARTAVLGGNYIGVYNGIFGAGYVANIGSMKLEANSFDIAYTLGGAYEVNNILSLAGGLRYVNGHQEFKGEVVLTGGAGGDVPIAVDLERTATGWGYFMGANIAPTDKLNFGLLYQSNTELDFKSDVKKDTAGAISPAISVSGAVGWSDGTKEREDLPGLIGVGASYQCAANVRTEINYTRYLESNAKFEGSRFANIGDSWEVGISLTYTFNPKWRASVGYLYTDIEGMDPTELLPEAAELDARTIGLGAVYSPTDKLDFTLGYTNVNYDAVTTDATSSRAPAGSKLEKDVWAVSFGVQYRWF